MKNALFSEMAKKANGRPVVDACLAEIADLRARLYMLRKNVERECADTDRLLQTGIGWTPDRTRTEGGSLKVAELADAMRGMTAPGSGG